MDYCQRPIQPKANEVLHCQPGVSVAASGRLAACDGMNHQDFVLLARDFLEAFTGRHVKWLRAGLGFIFGNHFVHLLRDVPFRFPVGKHSAGLGP